ncbi:hypothetical protein [Kitasatospora sp. NPDC097643]|uniref:hypothetical protein n=1 Tax=Kitasatospora sp. NPDC097643 TaxID=3157230 RepID=UPI003321C2F0
MPFQEDLLPALPALLSVGTGGRHVKRHHVPSRAGGMEPAVEQADLAPAAMTGDHS